MEHVVERHRWDGVTTENPHRVEQTAARRNQVVNVIRRSQTIIECKAPSTPATMSKQHCRMLQVERFCRQSRMSLQHCCRFGNNIAGWND